MMSRCLVVLFTLSAIASGCTEPPACDQLVSRLCAAAGETACNQLKSKGLTDHASCQAVLDDTAALNAQLDALVAATAAQALNPVKPASPAEGTPAAVPAGK